MSCFKCHCFLYKSMIWVLRMCWKPTHFQMPEHWTHIHHLFTALGNIYFHHCLYFFIFLLLSCGPVKIPGESFKCRMSSHRLQVFPWIAFPAVFCLDKGTVCNMSLPLYPFTLPIIDLMKRDRCKAAVTQRGGIWCKMPAGWLKNKETKRQEWYNRVMQL